MKILATSSEVSCEEHVCAQMERISGTTTTTSKFMMVKNNELHLFYILDGTSASKYGNDVR